MQEMLASLHEAMQHYRLVQSMHGSSLDTAVMPEVERLAFEHARAFAALQNALTAVVQCLQAETHPGLPQECGEALAELLAVEERLAGHLRQQRDMVGRQLAQLRHAKKALISYGGLPSLAPPTYIKASV